MTTGCAGYLSSAGWNGRNQGRDKRMLRRDLFLGNSERVLDIQCVCSVIG